MIEMKTAVLLLDAVTGKPIEAGVIVGRTLREPQLYDVLTSSGAVRGNVPADQVVETEQ